MDIVLSLLILIGAISGYREGFLMALFSLAAILLGVIGGFKLMGYAIVLLTAEFDMNETILPYVAFALVFIAILIVAACLADIVNALVYAAYI